MPDELVVEEELPVFTIPDEVLLDVPVFAELSESEVSLLLLPET